eukprot:4304180-Pleurochrysis_carterae.AAC.3
MHSNDDARHVALRNDADGRKRHRLIAVAVDCHAAPHSPRAAVDRQPPTDESAAMAAVRWMVIMAALYHSAVLAAMCRPTEFLQLVPHLTPQVQSVLQDRGISSPTPIQRAALPRVLNGESVVLHAETGSGKSLAFLLPAILRLGEARAKRCRLLSTHAV